MNVDQKSTFLGLDTVHCHHPGHRPVARYSPVHDGEPGINQTHRKLFAYVTSADEVCPTENLECGDCRQLSIHRAQGSSQPLDSLQLADKTRTLWMVRSQL